MRVYIIRKSSRRTIFSRYLSPCEVIYVLLSPRIEEQKIGERGREKNGFARRRGRKRAHNTYRRDSFHGHGGKHFCFKFLLCALYEERKNSLAVYKAERWIFSKCTNRICVSSQFFPRFRIRVEGPEKEATNTTLKFKIQKRKEQLSLVVVVVLPLANFFLTFPRFLQRVFALLHTHFNAQRNTTTKHYGKDIFLNSSSLTRRSRREKFYISSIEKWAQLL